MLDVNLIREQPDLVRKALSDRQLDPAPVNRILELDARRRVLLTEVEALKAERNAGSKDISQMKEAAGRQVKIEAMRKIGDKIADLDKGVTVVEEELKSVAATIPNLPDSRSPYGKDESENVVLRTEGQLPKFDFEPKIHWDLGPALGILDFERGVKITGSRFYVLTGLGARMQRALISYMLDLHARQGYTEQYTPFMVKAATLFAAGQLPKFAENLYHDAEEDLWMVPTAEVPLTGLLMDEIL
jgi:seryl-tRNA synthetase